MAESCTRNIAFNNFKDTNISFVPDKELSMYSPGLPSFLYPWILQYTVERLGSQVGFWRELGIWKSDAIWYGGTM